LIGKIINEYIAIATVSLYPFLAAERIGYA